MIDEDNELGGMTGCFRWSRKKILPSLPPLKQQQHLPPPAALLSEKGWIGFLTGRFDQSTSIEMIKKIKTDLSYIDCLSSPVTIAFIIQQQNLNDTSTPREFMNIIITAATFKNEERILRETNMWNEIAHSLPNVSTVNVFMVGPELSETREHLRIESLPDGRCIVYSLYQGTIRAFLRSRSALMQASSTVIFTLNGGFGNFENPAAVRFDLLLSWLPDLYLLTGLSKIPCYFTCANQYADVSGEFMIHNNVLGSRFVSEPAANPFGYATTLLPEETGSGEGLQADGDRETRGNSYWYGVQGFEAGRRRNVLQGGGDKQRVVADLLACLVPSEQAAPGQEFFLHEPYLDWAPSAHPAPLIAPTSAPTPAPTVPSHATTPAFCLQSVQQSVSSDGCLSIILPLPAHITIRDVELLVEEAGLLLVLRLRSTGEENRIALQRAVRTASVAAKVVKRTTGKVLKISAEVL